MLLAESWEEALAFARDYAAEHLAFFTKDPGSDLESGPVAGTVFLGQAAAVAYGDYLTGANHVLPTGGLARAFSSLSTLHYLRMYTWQEISPEAASEMSESVARMAEAEGLPGHAKAARARRTPALNNDAQTTLSPARRPIDRENTMTPFPREDYSLLHPYDPGRTPVDLDLSDNTNLWGAHPEALKAVRTASGESLTRYPSVYANRAESGGCREVWSSRGKHHYWVRFRRYPGFGVPGFHHPSRTNDLPRSHLLHGGDLLPHERVGSHRRALVQGRSRSRSPPPGRARPGLRLPPQQPDGSIGDRDWVLGLLALGGADGPVVVLDEAYADFAEDSFIQHARESDRLLVLRTLSKIYGLAGLRVGFAVGPKSLIEEVEKSRGPYKVNQVAEAAAVAALEDRSGWEEKIRREVVEKQGAARRRAARPGTPASPVQRELPPDSGRAGKRRRSESSLERAWCVGPPIPGPPGSRRRHPGYHGPMGVHGTIPPGSGSTLDGRVSDMNRSS